METRIVGGLRIAVPGLDPDDLEPVTEAPDDDLTEALVEGVTWPGLELAGARFSRCRLVGAELPDGDWRRGALSGCRFERVDLSGSRFDGTAIERCEFVGCRLTGVALIDVTLKDVVFEDCRFDYANLNRVRTAGPTVWTGGTFGRAVLTGCRLGGASLSGCRLDEVELAGCDLRGTDLRGTELSGVTGLMSLAGAVLDESQLPDLAVIAVRELDVTIRAPR
jgi:uncharacterized protein YjbI with pentapeptide repeats